MEFDLDDEELSVLDYARRHKLCEPYNTGKLHVGSLPVPTNDDLDWDLCDLSNDSITNATNALTRERLAVSKDAALLLRTVHELQQAPTKEEVNVDRRQWMLGLRQELPVLRTDTEFDMLNFGSIAIPNFQDLKIPFEIIDEDRDEGFAWPAKYLAYPAQCEERIKAEKLAVSRDVLLHLQDSISDPYTSEDDEKIKEEGLIYRLNTVHLPVTPPLLPLSPPLTPYIPSSPGNRLPLASDSSGSVVAEAKTLERQIMGADIFTRKSSDSSDLMLLDITQSPQLTPLDDERAPAELKRRGDDWKVEGPLTPPMLSDSPMKKLKSVSFPETLHQVIPEAVWATASDDGTDLDFDELFKEIEPLARKATMKAENEKLSGADTTARVVIPVINFTPPIPPWHEYSQRKSGKHRPDDTELGAQMKFLLRIKREDLKTASSWHSLSFSEREDIPWNIFTAQISKIHVDEKLHGETEFNGILTEMATGNVADSSLQVWKPEGLRILDQDDCEEEIEPAEMEERRDMEALVHKRKLEIEEELAEKHQKRMRSLSSSLPQGQPKDSIGSRQWNNEMPAEHKPANKRSQTLAHTEPTVQLSTLRPKTMQAPRDSGNDLMFGGFSATTALHKFMETRGKPIVAGSSGPADGVRPEKMTTLLVKQTLPVRSREPSVETQKASPSLPQLPIVPENLAPCSFIISSAFLQQRSLVKLTEQSYRQAEIIYRDYDSPHSPAKEADILLSPSTGLILTTLQQIKQRPLPGQPDRSSVKERLTALELRYERLVVVVSEGLNQEMEKLGSGRPDDPRDKEALANFESFASNFVCEVNIEYIPGGEQALARAIVIEMAKYGLIHGSQDIGDIKPVAAETTWEIFLRRIGINPFAAQVIIASLKTPFDVPISPSSSLPASSGLVRAVSVSGLSAFLVMGEEERVQFFQALMGGSRILRRVSRVLDQEWVSAAHGFKM